MRAHNFGAGPCALPVDVLEEVAAELTDFNGTGMSLVELSHRSKQYEAVHMATLDSLRAVASVPDDFDILFIQGGATLQFAMVPMNLLGPSDSAGVVVSGSWGKKALGDGSKHGSLVVAWDGAASGYTTMPSTAELDIDPDWRYLHVTSNETIGGIRMVDFPDTDVPLVADMSSDYLARPIDWDRYDLIYGGVQKNLAPAGMAVVFIRKSVAAAPANDLASYLRYGFHADSASLGNTPPMFPIYVMGKVLDRLAERGGIRALEERSASKAGAVYAVIDSSDGFYRSPVDPAVRSHMNVVFRLPDEKLEAEFVSDAADRNLIGLKGHRSVGGCRASLYAALEMESVEVLTGFMEEFKTRH
jgi:phosphoserine aminotransferase